jgi:hypothetical protein
MRIFSALRRLIAGRRKSENQHDAAWLADPLMHPDVRAMTERELADLPFGRGSQRGRDG